MGIKKPIVLSKPHLTQQIAYEAFYKPNIRYLILSNGRRWGKSQLLQIFGLKTLIKDGGKVGLLTPKYSHLSTFFREYEEKLREYSTRISQQDKIIILQNGASIEFFSGESADNIRSRSFDLFLLDEFAYLKDQKNVWEKIIRPTLSDRRGKAVFASSPNGGDFFYELFMKGQKDSVTYHKSYVSYNFPTITNPYIDTSEIEEARDTLTERSFRQEYLGEFLLSDAEVFNNIDGVSRLVSKQPYEGNFVMGADLARENDFSVITLIDVDRNEQVAYYRFTGVNFQTQIEEIISIYHQWKPAVFYCESNSFGKVIVEFLQSRGIDVEDEYTTHTQKRLYIEQLQLDIEKENILLLRDAIQMEELRNFGIHKTPSGNVTYKANMGHDDMVMALAIANYARVNEGQSYYAPLPIL